MKINRALLAKSYKVTVSAGGVKKYNIENIPAVSELMKFCAEHGFGLSEDLVKEFCKMEIKCFERTAVDLIKKLSEMTADVMYDAKIFYKNFPSDPLCMSPEDRFGFQLAYYIFGDAVRDFLPEKDKSIESLKPLNSNSKMLQLGTCTDVMNLYHRMMASPISLSNQDFGFLKEAFSSRSKLLLMSIPSKIPNKENLAFVSANMMTFFPGLFMEKCAENFRSATDVLRVIAYINDYSVTLREEKWSLKSIPRSQRKIIFQLLDQCRNIEQDMKRNISKWKSVAYCYHPFEYLKSETARNAFDHLYKNDLEKSFNAKVENAIANNDIQTVLKLLSSRPGEFARIFDRLLGLFPSEGVTILKQFEAIPAEQFEPKLLLQLMEHFRSRTQMKEYSLYLPRGGNAGVYAKFDNRLPISSIVADKIEAICKEKIHILFSNKPAMGKVYIDDSIKGYKVPLQQRNNSKSGIRVPARGSRIKSDPEKDIVRTFVWWTNMENGDRIDVDLSLKLYNDEMENVGDYYYGNFASMTDSAMVSSGDITDGGPFGGKGAAEYLDFSRTELLKKGNRYVQVCVNVFTGQNFSDFPCKFGFMQRDRINDNIPFEPSAVEGTIDIAADASNYSPAVYDLQKEEFIWIDVNGLGKNSSVKNVDGQSISFNAALYMATHNEIPDLYELVLLNAHSRGEIVTNKEEAEIIYSLTEGITPYDLDIISADLLSKEVEEEINAKETIQNEKEEGEIIEKTDTIPPKAHVDEDFIMFLVTSLTESLY